MLALVPTQARDVDDLIAVTPIGVDRRIEQGRIQDGAVNIVKLFQAFLNNPGICENGARLIEGDPVGLKDGTSQRLVITGMRRRPIGIPEIVEAAQMVDEPEDL